MSPQSPSRYVSPPSKYQFHRNYFALIFVTEFTLQSWHPWVEPYSQWRIIPQGILNLTCFDKIKTTQLCQIETYVDKILWIGSASLYAWKSRESAHRRRGEPHQVAFSFLLLRSVPEVPSISDPSSHILIVSLLTLPSQPPRKLRWIWIKIIFCSSRDNRVIITIKPGGDQVK